MCRRTSFNVGGAFSLLNGYLMQCPSDDCNCHHLIPFSSPAFGAQYVGSSSIDVCWMQGLLWMEEMELRWHSFSIGLSLKHQNCTKPLEICCPFSLSHAKTWYAQMWERWKLRLVLRLVFDTRGGHSLLKWKIWLQNYRMRIAFPSFWQLAFQDGNLVIWPVWKKNKVFTSLSWSGLDKRGQKKSAQAEEVVNNHLVQLVLSNTRPLIINSHPRFKSTFRVFKYGIAEGPG